MSNWTESRLPMIARIMLGLIFTVMGFNGFLQIIPMPAMPESATNFMTALAATGYMMPLIKCAEIIGGLMLLSGRFVPLGLALLAPGVVNIALFHLVLAPAGVAVGLLLLGLEMYLTWCYRDVFRPMLNPVARTTDSKAPQQRFAYDRG